MKLSFLGLVLLLAGTAAFADEPTKKLDFDGDLVEGVNKKPLDSVSQIHDGTKKKRRAHLYHYRTHYRDEMPQILKEVGVEN